MAVTRQRFEVFRFPVMQSTIRPLYILGLSRLRLPHTSRFFCRRTADIYGVQIGLKFVGTSTCRTLADFLPRLTAFRLRAESSKFQDGAYSAKNEKRRHVGKDACSRDSHDNLPTAH